MKESGGRGSPPHEPGDASSNGSGTTLHPERLLRGRKLVIIGGTGFLGKVFWSLLLSSYPGLARIYLLVRPKNGQTAEERFWADIATSEVLRPLRDQYGPGFEQFIREKVVPVSGDVVHPYCGIDASLRDELRGEIDVVINASGVIDFDPPLDIALEVNAFGVQNLVALARDLGDTRLMHTSTCYVAGERTGFIEEGDPREPPFPRSGELERAHWDPDGEIAECLDVIEQARHRAGDAFRQSRFLDEAKRRLLERDEPSTGKVLEDEIERVRRKYVEARLAEMGTERANFWGWPNTYTYTKSIGEQIVVAAGLPFTIVRPAVVESSVSFPMPGWNEGVNTSAPLLYAVVHGQTQIPGGTYPLDVIPCDMVAAGMVLALAELIEGKQKTVYQYGSSDVNPCPMWRFAELVGLYKRKRWQRSGEGGPIVSFLQAHVESAIFSEESFEKYGPAMVSRGASAISKLLGAAAVGKAAPLFGPAAKALDRFADQQLKVKKVLDNFVPFVARYHYRFRCDNTRAAYERLGPEDRQKLNWTPETIDWRHWFLDIHMPGLEKWVFPEIDKRLERRVRAPIHHETLPSMLKDMASRHDLAVALQRTEADGLSRYTFREWHERALATAGRLRALGVGRGDRVVLSGANHPAWAIAFFGIQLAGATVVPVDAGVEPGPAANIVRASRAKVWLADEKVTRTLQGKLGPEAIGFVDLQAVTLPGDPAEPQEVMPGDVAALIYTSGTTGNPKGVMLSQQNLAALVAALAPLFPLGRGDRVLSVLPLHHTFELTCGLLLPLSRGARVIYIDDLTAERLEHGMKAGRVTAMVGVPALWELLERKLSARVAERGPLAGRVFDVAVELNRAIGKSTGLDAGRLLFGPVHDAFGGHLRYLVSGGAALSADTHRLFAGLGLHLTEGYGLTEASPVLAVAQARPGSRAGHVGRAIPGVELRISEPNGEGVGEILARGPNVMLGYADDDEETRRTIDDSGWLHTGDLGKIDRSGNLSIVGRAKDTIVASNGENVYPDDVEARIGQVDHIAELVVLGVTDHRGGERIACVAVPSEDEALGRAERHARAKATLDRELARLAVGMRPSVTLLIDVPLPRTATKKVKRAEVRRLVERVTAPMPTEATGASPVKLEGAARLVRGAVSIIARRTPGELTSGMTLRGDLGFDSLMLLELLVALEGQVEGSVDADRLNSCETIGDVESLVQDTSAGRRLARAVRPEGDLDDESSLELPPALRDAAMRWLGTTQMGFYRRVMRTTVTGSAFIPQNRNVLVAANHASHLDMGLVKYGLGPYGQGMVSLAAQDYFFEGPRWRKAYFENLTNLVPLSRSGSLRQSLRLAGNLIDEGKVVLIFPEGTRSTDGSIQEFKPAVGHLALQHRADVLPVWLGGTYEALPKGASVIKDRRLRVRIGPPLAYEEFRRLTQGMSQTDASRTVARLTRRAVVALSRGEVLDLATLAPADVVDLVDDESLADLFRELEHRFVAGSVTDPVSFYFSLGRKERWTVKVTPDACEVMPGKAGGSADCVLKTSPAMFTRIVREAYTPTPGEFISGSIKSNNVALLMTFQKAFHLAGEGS